MVCELVEVSAEETNYAQPGLKCMKSKMGKTLSKSGQAKVTVPDCLSALAVLDVHKAFLFPFALTNILRLQVH